MNKKMNQLFLFIFVFVLAQEGLAKTVFIKNMSDVVKNLHEHYIPATPKSFKRTSIKNFKRTKYSISFQTTTTPVRIEWDKNAQFIKLNGLKLNRKVVKNTKHLLSKVRHIIGYKKNSYSLFELIIPKAQAAPNDLARVITQLLQHIFININTMSKHQPPTYVQNFSTSNYSQGNFSEVTQSNNSNTIFAQPVPAANNTQQPLRPNSFAPPKPSQSIAPTTTAQANNSANCPSGYDSMECEVVRLTNEHRRKNGRHPLKIGTNCTRLANSHAKDMSHNRFFSHTSPSQGSFGQRAQTFGLRGSAENISSGQRSAQRVMQTWISSPGHNQNLLQPNFKEIGVSKVGNKWVQCFAQ